MPVSAGLLADMPGYFETLTAYLACNPAAIVEKMARGFVCRDQQRAPTRCVRRGTTAWQLADLLIRQPVIDAARAVSELAIAPQNAQRAIAHSRTQESSPSSPTSPEIGCGNPVRCSLHSTTSLVAPVGVADEGSG